MSFEDYTKACRLGRKAYQRNLMKGVYPYLQALDETISHEIGRASCRERV